MKKINVQLKHHQYPIVIGSNLLSDKQLWSDLINERQVVVVTNDIVAQHYLSTLLSGLAPKEPLVITLADGEAVKNLHTIEDVVTKLIQAGIDRQAVILALGGGVIGDTAGFVAATYMRGIDYIQVPTTLLAQCDAAIGGKTGVNHQLAKNMIGAFHQPIAVVSDCNTLATLSERHYVAGLAEVAKYGLIQDANFFAWLEQNITDLRQRNISALRYAVTKCSQVKAGIVMQDEYDQGVRNLLNFGHTFAHAIEKAFQYRNILHGEAVSIGMILSSQLSLHVNPFELSQIKRIKQFLKSLNLPITLPININSSELLQYMKRDKKKIADNLRMILLKDIGHAYIYDNVDKLTLTDVIQACYE